MMNKILRFLLVLMVFLGVLFLPLLGSLAATGALPEGYGEFPVVSVDPPPGFDLGYFIFLALIALVIVLFLAFPRIFGFQKSVLLPALTKVKLPWWFWFSLPVTLISWFLMWARLPLIYSLEHYAYLPLAWGFIGLLDGMVYRRNGGKSLMATLPTTFKLMILVSTLSWFVFEYLNFFVRGNWYYPNADKIFSGFGNIIWFFLGYTTVLTGIFEWYSLLRTFRVLDSRYRQGPRFNPGTLGLWIMVALGMVLAFGMGYAPYPLFWAIWVSLTPGLGAGLTLAGKSNLLDPLRNGDWTDLSLVALGTLCNGIFWELWNFGSQWFHQGFPTTPGYWRYSVPYIDVLHVFSEMPLLGYTGYLLFGLNCWILWNTAAYFLGFDDKIESLFPSRKG